MKTCTVIEKGEICGKSMAVAIELLSNRAQIVLCNEHEEFRQRQAVLHGDADKVNRNICGMRPEYSLD